MVPIPLLVTVPLKFKFPSTKTNPEPLACTTRSPVPETGPSTLSPALPANVLPSEPTCTVAAVASRVVVVLRLDNEAMFAPRDPPYVDAPENPRFSGPESTVVVPPMLVMFSVAIDPVLVRRPLFVSAPMV